jgi:HSP20 family protein
MPNVSTQKPEQKEKAATTERALAPYGDFPFFLSQMRDEFARMFQRFTLLWPSLWGGAGSGWSWGLDVTEDDDAITIRAEAPGFEAGDFDIRVTDNRFVLRAAKKVETKDEKGKVLKYRERECYESLPLPSGIDKDKVEANYRDGVLTMTFPKTTEGKGKLITVKNT